MASGWIFSSRIIARASSQWPTMLHEPLNFRSMALVNISCSGISACTSEWTPMMEILPAGRTMSMPGSSADECPTHSRTTSAPPPGASSWIRTTGFCSFMFTGTAPKPWAISRRWSTESMA